ncbi:hypothetical protein [Bordetella genomosp. 4]|uniref:Preprotein translocase subunit TatB n=1 Tax=Bordetella genomosp. 4 TaxID=463044 RepID=A0A261U5D6_9BORD|nr:hypothetical protein [Bordetella genomosp. 4]OZI56697.1 hypothetical protein CAL20_14945 [Bordetella genomosp. 4]
MLVKILIIAVFIVLVMYVVLPKRRVSTVSAAPTRGSRLALNLFASAATLLFILALFCLLLWLGGLAGIITGGGEVLNGTGLLRIGGVLFVLAIACALAAWTKRPR